MLPQAIERLDQEVQDLIQQKPEEGSLNWWLLRGKATGLSCLRAMQSRGLTNPVEAEEFRKGLRKELTEG